MGFSKSALLLSILLFLSFGFQMVAVVSVPVTTQITLANFNGYIYGIWGYCKADGSNCSGIHVGYEEIPSGESFSLPRSARHSLSRLLIVHVVSTGCTLLLFLGSLVTNCVRGPTYLLILLVWAVPVFMVTLLAFLVEILLFVNHLSFAGWFTLVAVVLNAASFVVLCLFRRSRAAKLSSGKNGTDYGEMGELSHVGLLNDQDEDKLVKPNHMFELTRLESNDSSRSTGSRLPQRPNAPTGHMLPNLPSNYVARQPPLPIEDRRPTAADAGAPPPRPQPPPHQLKPVPAGTYMRGMESPSLNGQSDPEMARSRQAPQGHPTVNEPMVARSTSHQAIVDYADETLQPAPPPHRNRAQFGPGRQGNLNINTASMYRNDLPPVDSEPATPMNIPAGYNNRMDMPPQRTPLERFMAEPAPTTTYREEPPTNYTYDAPHSPTHSDSAYTSISQRAPVYQYSHPPTLAGTVPLTGPTRSEVALQNNPDFSIGERTNRFQKNRRRPGRPMGPF